MSRPAIGPSLWLSIYLLSCGDHDSDPEAKSPAPHPPRASAAISEVEAQIAKELTSTDQGKQMLEAQKELTEVQRMFYDPRVGDGLKSPEMAVVAAAYRGMLSDLERAEWALQAQPRVERIPFRELYGFFPEVPGWTRGTLTGTAEVGTAPISRASTRYRKDGAIVEVEVTDYGARPTGLDRALRLTWPGRDEDKEHGFERSGVMRGVPCYQEWSRREYVRSTRHGDTFESTGRILLLVANRFTIELDSKNVERFEDLIPFIETLDLEQLTRVSETRSSHL